MTTTSARPAVVRPAGGEAPRPRPVLTGLDLLAGGLLLTVAVLAWVSLALAHLALHSLPAVLAVTAVLLGVLAVLGARVGRPRLRLDGKGLVVALGCVAVGAALTFPGFSYGVTDKDPGGYVSHAIAISQTGDHGFIDPLLETEVADPTFPVQMTSPGARFAGVWIGDASTGRIVPQFFHLWPSLLATSYDAAGRTGLLMTVPFMGVLAVLVMVAVLRRVGDALVRVSVGDALVRTTAGLVAAGAGGLMLATNMLQVWQARFPTTEVLAQALYVGALLGVVVALQTGWRPAAGAAGLLVGISWLNRSDGFLLVLLALGVGAVLIAVRRWDGRATWFAAGLGVVLPHALLQAYDLALIYTNNNPHLTLGQVTLIASVVVAAALVLRVAGRRPLDAAVRALEGRRWQVLVGLAVLAGAAGLITLGYLRHRLFGPDLFSYNGREARSYDEAIMARLTWFFGLPTFAIMLLGLAVVAVRRWSAPVWAVVLPTLPLFALYGYTASNSTRLLWWTRRYVPTVLPGIVILVALAIAWFAVTRYRGRRLTAVPAALSLVAIVAFFLSQSLPLRAHDEWKGSFEVTQRIADLSGDADGVYLWEADQDCCAGVTRLFASPVWLQHGELSALLPNNTTQSRDVFARARMLDRYAERFPGQPMFVVADDGELPAGIEASRVELADRFPVSLPVWEESDLERPDESRLITLDVSVWRVR